MFKYTSNTSLYYYSIWPDRVFVWRLWSLEKNRYFFFSYVLRNLFVEISFREEGAINVSFWSQLLSVVIFEKIIISLNNCIEVLFYNKNICQKLLWVRSLCRPVLSFEYLNDSFLLNTLNMHRLNTELLEYALGCTEVFEIKLLRIEEAYLGVSKKWWG